MNPNEKFKLPPLESEGVRASLAVAEFEHTNQLHFKHIHPVHGFVNTHHEMFTYHNIMNADIPVPPTGPYIDNFAERYALFDSMQLILRSVGMDPLHATSLGIIMVAPIHKVTWMKYHFERFDLTHLMARAILRRETNILYNTGPEFLTSFVARRGLPVVTNASIPAVAKCRSRYGHRCLITGSENPEVAHLFPFAGNDDLQDTPIDLFWCGQGRKSPQSAIYSILLKFWGYSDTWRELFSNGALSESRNLICFSPQFNLWWNQGKFALKPIRRTGNEVHLQFHWLKPSSLSRGEEIQGNAFLPQAGLDNLEWGQQVAYDENGSRIQTGQVFVIRALHPEDLPDIGILELQWDFMRIAAIACGGQVANRVRAEQMDGL